MGTETFAAGVVLYVVPTWDFPVYVGRNFNPVVAKSAGGQPGLTLLSSMIPLPGVYINTVSSIN